MLAGLTPAGMAASLAAPDPYVRNYRIRLLLRVNGVKASIRVHVQDSTLWKPPVGKTAEAVPREAMTLAPAAKRAKPVPRHLCSKGFNALEITWNSIIVQKPLDNRTEPLTHLGDGIVESAPELELHFLKLATKPLGYRLSLDREALPLTGGCTDVSKTEEIESLGLTQARRFRLAAA